MNTPSSDSLDKSVSADASNPAVPEQKKLRKKSRLRTAGIAAGCVILAGLILSMLLFRNQPDFQRPRLTPGDWMRQSSISMKFLQKVLQSKPGDLAEMHLSPQDVNSILRTFQNYGRTFAQEPEQVPYCVEYRDGIFHLDYACKPLFGSCRIVLHGEVSARYSDNTFKLHGISCKIGALPVPGIAVQHLAESILREQESSRFLRLFHLSVESIEQDPAGNITLVYYPHKLKNRLSGGFF